MSKSLKIAVPLVVALMLLAGFGLWWFFSDDAPAEVSLAAATEQVITDVDDDGSPETPTDPVAETTAEDAGAADASPDVSSTGEEATATTTGETTSSTAADSAIAGTWTVDAESGDFDYETATGSFVGFRIEEELRGIGSTTAVGRTGGVVGSLTIDGTTVTAASFEVDMTSLTTDDSRRDDNMHDALDVDSFPAGSFVLTSPIELGEAAASGEAVQVTGSGDLTIHGVTRAVTMELQAQLVADTVVVVGSMDITFADYDVAVPTSGIVVSVEDFGILELQLLFTR